MLRRVMSRMLFIQTSLYLYSCTKRVCFNTNELDESLPSVVVSLLQEYEDVFPTMCLVDCHLLEE